MKLGSQLAMALGVILVIVLLFLSGQLAEQLDAKQIMVIQSPFRGKLNCYITPGVKWQGFGTVTKYEKRDQFWFSSKQDQGQTTNESLSVRFNDGAHANISGSFGWEMPLDDEHIGKLWDDGDLATIETLAKWDAETTLVLGNALAGHYRFPTG